jgi:serine/threonine protein kinase/predicted ATPase
MNRELSPNTTLSHYRIVAKLGAGGMGEVWVAEDTRLDRKVALKLLPSEFTRDADRVRRFIQEAKAASALNHPNIITVHDIGESEAGRFIVMELVSGRTLRAVIAEDNSIETLLALGVQMARALSAAHAAGITHRDFKPENVMVRDDGYVKVLDFGLARLLPSTASGEEAATLAQQTMPGQLLGTVAYMSPEQAAGESVGHSSDIFALGIVLYEAAAGRHPFRSDSLVGYLHAITSRTAAPPITLRPELPAVLNALIMRMLEREASRRPSSGEVAGILQDIERRSWNEEPPARSGPRESLIRGSVRAAGTTDFRHTVGRESELGELRSAFSAAKAGRSSLQCVAGEPGIGKTTLVEELLAELAREDCTVARGRCSERLAGTEAYLPLLEALDSLLQGGGYQMAGLMKQVAPTWYAQIVPLSASDEESARLLAEVRTASQERMKRELGNFLQETSRRRPLVLFLDDLHWADVSTIDMLSFLTGRFDALKALIVTTYRPSDMLLNKHPFLQIKPDLQARGICRELLLEFLNEAEIAEYLALEFEDNRFPAEFPRLIHAKTEGSPLFMADLVRYLRDRGVIASQVGAQDEAAPGWTLSQALPDIERELPESVRGMIERKVAQLSEEDRKLLTVASVQGYEFDSAVIAEAQNLDADEVEERLEKLERVFAFVKLVSEAEYPNHSLTLRYRFVHVLYQNALYASLRVTRKASLSAAVARSLERFHGTHTEGVANEIALLWETAREYGRAADWFLLAARNASQAFAHHEAAALSRRGLAMHENLADGPDRIRRELELQLTLGPAVMVTLGWAAPELESVYSRARENCLKLGDREQLFPVLTGLWNFYLLRADYRSARNLGEELLDLAQATQDPSRMVVAHWALVESSFWSADYDFTARHVDQVVSLYDFQRDRSLALDYGQDPWVICRAYDAARLLLLGYPQQALERVAEVRTRANDLDHPFDIGMALLWSAKIHLIRREPQQTRELADALAALSQEHGFAFTLHVATAFQGWALVEEGEVEEGIAGMNSAISAFRGTGTVVYGSFLDALLAEALGKAGRVTEGMKLIDQAVEFAESKEERFYEPELHRIKGELLLRGGASASEGASCFQSAIEIARRQKAGFLELRAVTSLARLWQHEGKRAEAQALVAQTCGRFTEGFDTRDLIDAKALLEIP